MPMTPGKLTFLAIVSALTVGCGQHPANFRTVDPIPLELMCSLAEKTQMFKVSVEIDEEHLKGNLVVFDIRHKFLVEKSRGAWREKTGFGS